jgi:hypothetical protein
MIFDRFLSGIKTGAALFSILIILNTCIYISAEKTNNDFICSIQFLALIIIVLLCIVNLAISKYNIILRAFLASFLLFYCSLLGYLMWSFLTNFD